MQPAVAFPALGLDLTLVLSLSKGSKPSKIGPAEFHKFSPTSTKAQYILCYITSPCEPTFSFQYLARFRLSKLHLLTRLSSSGGSGDLLAHHAGHGIHDDHRALFLGDVQESLYLS